MKIQYYQSTLNEFHAAVDYNVIQIHACTWPQHRRNYWYDFVFQCGRSTRGTKTNCLPHNELTVKEEE